MAHEITNDDSLVLRKERAWHGLGTIIQNDISAVEACEQYGLGWEVQPWPLMMKNPVTGEIHEVPNQFANVREIQTSEGAVPSVLGLVSERYEVCQNRDLAEFMDALTQTGRVTIETAGSIKGGKRIWFLAKADSFELNGGDKTYSYILGSNAHDGTGAIRLDPTDIRVVCANTLRMVVPDGKDWSRNSEVSPAAITVQHSSQIVNRLEEAKLALREYDSIKAKHRQLCEKLSERRATRISAMEFFAEQYTANFSAVEDADSDKKAKGRQKRMSRAAAAFMSRFEAECEQFGGRTAWLALNAWTGFVQHDLQGKTRKMNDVEKQENRNHSNLFGVNRTRSSQALVAATHWFLGA